jgi:hypothetical protein
MTSGFVPKDFLDLANDLKKCETESANRTILNRCYYSCFLRLKKIHAKKEKGDISFSHDFAFIKINRKHKKLALRLNKLYAARLVADYSLDSIDDKTVYRTKFNTPYGPFKVDVNKDINEFMGHAEKFHEGLDEL